MPDPKIVEFKPRWMRELTEEDRRVLDDFAGSGSVPPGPPRINARILPVGGSNLVSAKTLGEAIGLTQSIVQYAGNDVCNGFNPDFADLRSLNASLVALTKLSIEPFEEGSFVIPARLEGEPVAAAIDGQSRQVTAEDVVNRFDELLLSLREPRSANEVSIGAIQAIESLGRVIRREADAVEFSSFDVHGRPRRTLRIDTAYISQVQKIRASRGSTQAILESLEGTITALDLVANTLHLRLRNVGGRVRGTFPMLFQPTLVERLGRRVFLHGVVEHRGKRILSIQVASVEVPDDDA